MVGSMLRVDPTQSYRENTKSLIQDFHRFRYINYYNLFSEIISHNNYLLFPHIIVWFYNIFMILNWNSEKNLDLFSKISVFSERSFLAWAYKNLDEGSVKTLIQALVFSRLEYCNPILANLPDVTLAQLVRVQHSAARLIRNLNRKDPV